MDKITEEETPHSCVTTFFCMMMQLIDNAMGLKISDLNSAHGSHTKNAHRESSLRGANRYTHTYTKHIRARAHTCVCVYIYIWFRGTKGTFFNEQSKARSTERMGIFITNIHLFDKVTEFFYITIGIYLRKSIVRFILWCSKRMQQKNLNNINSKPYVFSNCYKAIF